MAGRISGPWQIKFASDRGWDRPPSSVSATGLYYDRGLHPSAENGSPEDIDVHLVSRRPLRRADRFCHHPFPRRRKNFPRRRARRRRDLARSRPQGRGRDRHQAAGQAQARGRGAVQEPRPRRRRQYLCADRHGRAQRRQGLAPLGRYLAAHSRHRGRRRLDPHRAGADRGLYRLSAVDHARGRVGRAGDARQCLHQARGVAAGADRAEARARPARDARAQSQLRGLAREIWLPRLEFQRGLRCGEPARLLPVQRDLAQAHRLFALRVGRGPGQAGALGRRSADLRRGAEARRQLRHHAPRRAALDGRRGPAQGRGVQYLCARPEPVGQARRARPMCCRAPASRASRSSPSTPT